MRILRNVALLSGLYALAWWGAQALLGVQTAPVRSQVLQWLWTLGAFIVGATVQLQWKVHETKRLDGLSSPQRLRLGRTAKLLVHRMNLLIIATALASFGGILANALAGYSAADLVAQFALATMLTSFVLWCLWQWTITNDVQRFETRFREEATRKAERKALADRLKKS